MPLEPIYSKRLCSNKQICLLWTLPLGFNNKKSLKYHYFCFKIMVLLTFSELISISLFLNYMKMHCSITCITKTAKLKVENSGQSTWGFILLSFHAPQYSLLFVCRNKMLPQGLLVLTLHHSFNFIGNYYPSLYRPARKEKCCYFSAKSFAN